MPSIKTKKNGEWVKYENSISPSIIVAYENLNDDLKAKVDSIDTVAETAESAKTTAEATAAAIPSLHTYSLSVPGNGSVKFSIDSNVFMFGRYLATAATASAAYVLTSYSAYRAPLVTELAAGSHITVTSGGDNTNGWYIQVSCTASAGAGLYLIGSCVPTIIS